MQRCALLVLVTALLTSSADAEFVPLEPEPTEWAGLFGLVDIEGEAPVIAVCTEEPNCYDVDGHGLCVAIWEDGRVVWGQDLARGSPPYQISAIPTEDVRRLGQRLALVHAEASLGDHPSDRRLSGWHTVINVRSGGSQVSVRAYSERPTHEDPVHVLLGSLLEIISASVPEQGHAYSATELSFSSSRHR